MQLALLCRGLIVVAATAMAAAAQNVALPSSGPATEPELPAPVRIVQLVEGNALRRSYVGALTSLLTELNQQTTLRVDEQPIIIASFEDPVIFKHPFLFVNFADRADWTFTAKERQNLKDYLERGGFMFIDAGINAEFLRGDVQFGQHHSFAEWDATPALKEAFRTIFPDKTFEPLSRSHPFFRSFYSGLPDPSALPESVREYVVNEKWPDGTYSAVALTIDGRVAVMATPIISMGWGKDTFGKWITTIRFRIREGVAGLSERLETAAYSGARFETVREDGRKDILYCQNQALPAWVQEPDGKWRVFRYYHSTEISEFAHVFYTRLGINLLVYALTQ